MPLVLGIDEAGYGPLLGPLVIGATLWEVPAEHVGGNLWKVLSKSVRRAGGERDDARLCVDDSKKAFDRKSIATLERTVLAFVRLCGAPAGTVSELLAALGCDLTAAATGCPWYADLTQRLPLDPVRSACTGAAERLAATLAARAVRCCGLRVEVLPEDCFNRQIALTRNKAAVELTPVLRLMQWGAGLSGSAGDGRGVGAYSERGERCGRLGASGLDELHILVDRLGGRTDYRELLMQAFPERHLHIVSISDDCSRYRLAAPSGDWHVEFRVNGDGVHLPIALASMLAKYVRELIMERFNEYWRRLAEQSAPPLELKPTAGYYGDARRFIAAVTPLAKRLALPIERFVRER